MGKHSKPRVEIKPGTTWSNATPEQKAQAFDDQYDRSKAEGQAAQAAGEYPYDIDAKFKR